MIRHIVLCTFTDSATPERVEQIRTELAQLGCPGRTSFTMGPDLGLREGNMDVAIVADFTDIAAYQAYDVDPAHDQIRRELIAPIVARTERCQFEM